MSRLQRVAPALRLAATAVIFVILARRIHIGDVVPHDDPGALALIGGAVVMTFVGVVASAFRWQRVLTTLDVHVRLLSLTRTYLASLFVGNFLPSTVGGDVVRVSRLAAETRQSPRAFASVVLERLSGWIVLPGLTFVGLAVNPPFRSYGSATALAVGTAVLTLIALGTVLFIAGHPRVGRRLQDKEGWRRFIAAVHTGVDRFRRRPLQSAGVLAAGVVYQLAVLSSVFLAAKALDLPIGFTAVLAFFPAVAILQALPLTLGGLGVREYALFLFLRPMGVHSSQAVALGVLFYGMNLVVSLLGAPAFAAGARRHPVELPAPVNR